MIDTVYYTLQKRGLPRQSKVPGNLTDAYLHPHVAAPLRMPERLRRETSSADRTARELPAQVRRLLCGAIGLPDVQAAIDLRGGLPGPQGEEELLPVADDDTQIGGEGRSETRSV